MARRRAIFRAMASEHAIVVDGVEGAVADAAVAAAITDVRRIEAKYSRYRDDSVTSAINRAAGGAAVAIDAETAALLDYADQCFRLSGGRFDVTSGVLRRAWDFRRKPPRVPDAGELAALCALVGWQGVERGEHSVRLPRTGMEIDFGGIGKEYAVDRALALVISGFDGAALVNFGGDMAASRAPPSGPWRVGVERPGQLGEARLLLDFERGGLATSGDTHRFIEHEGRRYSHILDVRTGYPVVDPPRSVTVAASCCLEAGMIATLSMLKGAGAEQFLEEQGVTHWCLR